MYRVVKTFLIVSVATLAFASPAFAQEAPQLQVFPFITGVAAQTDTDIDLSIPAGAAATAKVVLYVPTGYTANLGQAPGTKIADVGVAVDVRGTTVPLIGTADADSPASYASDPRAQACAPGVHAAVWVIRLPTQTRTLSIPMYVDPTSGAEAQLGAYKIQACFASPDVPEAEGGAPLGVKVVEADVDFLDAFTNPATADAYVWRALVTPYVAGTGTPNAAGTYELRSVAFIPVVFTLRARYDKRNRVATLSGRLVRAGVALPSVTVAIVGGPTRDVSQWRLIGTARGRNGSFSLRTKSLRRTTFIAGVVLPEASGCLRGGPSAAPAGCLRETTAPFLSNVARLVVPRRR